MKRYDYIDPDTNMKYQSPVIDQVANQLNDELEKIINEADIEENERQKLLDKLNCIEELNELRTFASDESIRSLKKEEVNGETV